MATSSRWLAVSSDLYFRYDSVSAHASTATATASLYFLSAWYCSAPPPRIIDRHSSSGCWRRQPWLQYRVSHLTHFPSQFWSKGAAQTQQVVRIIVLLKPESL